MIRETLAICAAVKGQREESRERELIGERGRGPRVSEGRGKGEAADLRADSGPAHGTRRLPAR
jgi:hypothetical protein